MTTRELEDESKLIKDMRKWLLNINLYFELIIDHNNKPVKIVYYQGNKQLLLYNFHMKNFYYNYLTSITAPEFYALQNVVNDYWQKSKDFQKTSNDSESENGLTMGSTEITLTDSQTKNPFKKYTDRLAETLQEKNKAYGDSFAQSVDDYGLRVIGIRLSDKYNRVKHLVNSGELKENDESLEDTLLDMAGYSILGLKYLKEHENENN